MNNRLYALLAGLVIALPQVYALQYNSLLWEPLTLLYQLIPPYGGHAGHVIDAIILAGIFFSSATAVKKKSNVGNAVIWAAGGLWIGLVSFLATNQQLIFNSVFVVIFATILLVLTIAPWIKYGLQRILGEKGNNWQWIFAISLTTVAIGALLVGPLSAAPTNSEAEEQAKNVTLSSFEFAQGMILLSVLAGFILANKKRHPNQGTPLGSLEKGFLSTALRPQEDEEEKDTQQTVTNLEEAQKKALEHEASDDEQTIKDVHTLQEAITAMQASVKQYAQTIESYKQYIDKNGPVLPEEHKQRIREAVKSFKNYLKTIREELDAFVQDTAQEEKDFAESAHQELLTKAREYLNELQEMEYELETTQQLIKDIKGVSENIEQSLSIPDAAHEILADCKQFSNLRNYSKKQFNLLYKKRESLLEHENSLKKNIDGLAKVLEPLNKLLTSIQSSLKKSKKIAKQLHEDLERVGDPLAKGLLEINPAPCQEALKKLSHAQGQIAVEQQLAQKRHETIQNSKRYVQALKAWEEQGHKFYQEDRKELQEINQHAQALLEAGKAAQRLHEAVEKFFNNPPANFKKQPAQAINKYFKQVTTDVTTTAQETHVDKNQELMNHLAHALTEVKQALNKNHTKISEFFAKQTKDLQEENP